VIPLVMPTIRSSVVNRVSAFRSVIAFVSLCSFALGAPVLAQSTTKTKDPAGEFFKAEKAVEISLEIGDKEMDSLRKQDRTYVKVKLTEGKDVYKDVGVHLRGSAGSYRPIDDHRPGLTINMDKFVDGQRFHGLDKFHLCNSAQDPSYLSELICGEMMRAAGIPASRIGHAVVTLNGKKRGLYYLKEGYDHQFMKVHFGTSDGNFYDGGFLRDVDQPLQLISGKNDVKDHADLKALVAAANEPDQAKRFEKLEKLLEMDKFISMLVMEVITWDWDGYPLKPNNYRIYHDPKKDKITFIPSGMDQMFAEPNGPILPGFQARIARAVMETKQGKERYIARMEEIIKNVYKPTDLVKRLDEMEKKLQPVITAIDAGAGKDFPNQVARLKQAIPARAKSIEAQLKQLKKK
jgi:spore coat protein CotH